MIKLKITLESDLCSASGDGFASVIDTDVSYDRYGFPFIGARRLKGCLRDAAELIGSDKINEIFGVTGSDISGSLKISDALIEKYDILKNEAVGMSLNAEKIISLFTYTRSSTSINLTEDGASGTAKDNSLRFTRVVKQYSPFENNKKLVFFADVEIDSIYFKEFEDICKSLHNIGYKRNRGFGAVNCELIEEEKSSEILKKTELNCENTVLGYTVKLSDTLMIPGSSSDQTIDFIPGTSVLGYFAGAYIRSGKSASTTEFEEIFLKNNVKFSNLYISDENGSEYFPAPVIMGKIKGESGVFNIVEYKNTDDKIIKPIKSGYYKEGSVVIKPFTETVYHHSTKDKKTLYTQTCLEKDQFFSGTISGKAEYVEIIRQLMAKGNLRFGRSKTAQYSLCKPVSCYQKKYEDATVKISRGETFIALLCSDVLISDNAGGYDISVNRLKNALGIEYECDNQSDYKRSALRYRVITGYNTKWNIQKPHIRTIAAGSTLVFTAEKDEELPKIKYIGEKQNEGFGKVMFMRSKDIPAVSEKSVKEEQKTAPSTGMLADLINKNHFIEKMRSDALNMAEKFSGKVDSSQIGRLTLMVKTSKTMNDFKKKTECLKNQTTKDYIQKLTEASEYYNSSEFWKDYYILILIMNKYFLRQKKGGMKK